VPGWLDWGAAWGWRLLVIAAAVVVFTLALSRLVVIVIPIIVAIMLSTVLVPAAQWLRRHRWPPLAATWAVFLAAFAVVAGLLFWLVPTVAGEFRSLGRQATQGVHKVQHWLVTGPLHLSRSEVRHDFNQVGHYFSSHASGLAVQGATLAAEVVVGLLLTLVITFFFVKDSDRITAGVLHLVGERQAVHWRALGTRCWATISGYMRGTTANGVINGVLMGVGVWLLGVPLALPIGVLTFFGGYFPIVGSIVSGGLAALVALVAVGPTAALIVIGITIAIHNIEGYLVGPLVLGRSVHLHPLAVLLALAVGTVVAGVVGAFVAVPLTATATDVVAYYRSVTGPRSELAAPEVSSQ
jgi:putative heme transporter